MTAALLILLYALALPLMLWAARYDERDSRREKAKP